VVGAGAHIPQPSKRRPFREQRTVNPLIVPARYNFFYPSSRPALRAAACGGRPRAGGDATVTRGTGLTLTQGDPKQSRRMAWAGSAAQWQAPEPESMNGVVGSAAKRQL
jgi:hypothetical protein